jgi:hypothetical protein
MRKWLAPACLALAITAIVVACGGDDDQEQPEPSATIAAASATEPPATATDEPTTEPTETSEPTSTPVTPSPTSSIPTATPTASGPILFPFNFPVTYEDGATVTVFTFEAPVPPPSQFRQPDPGNVFLAIEVQECAGPNSTEEMHANPFNWGIRMPDNTLREPGISVREPALHSADLTFGDCVRGWVTFQVPDGVPPTQVIFDGPGYAQSRWAMP